MSVLHLLEDLNGGRGAWVSRHMLQSMWSNAYISDLSPGNAENYLKLVEKNKWIRDERGISKESEIPEQITVQGA